MTFFFLLIGFIISQRLIEIRIAKRNEQRMIAQGGYEAGGDHYKYIVLLHATFFVSLLFEVTVFTKSLSPVWEVWLLIFVMAQLLRIWTIKTLGRRWNTKIIVMPDSEAVVDGPYQFVRHPNYVVVAAEIISVPSMFHAYTTAVSFTILNALMMAVRIPAEEKALVKTSDYEDAFRRTPRSRHKI